MALYRGVRVSILQKIEKHLAFPYREWLLGENAMEYR
jgi:hypothetical protein